MGAYRNSLTLVMSILLFASFAVAAEGPDPDCIRKDGERMYRLGLLPSGAPMTGVVQEDIPISGEMFSCAHCHLRSGLGAREGRTITPPINGPKLLAPRYRGAEIVTSPPREEYGAPFRGTKIRSAYTIKNLKDAIRYGTNPDGLELDWNMPRYELSDADADILARYLLGLSNRFSPGVDDETLTLATVIDTRLPETERRALISTLEAYIKTRNNDPRRNRQRASKGVFYHQESYSAYRTLRLSIWELQGPASSWPKQLENYYQKNPPFALVAGRVRGSWQPIQDFCEQKQLPALFPLTDRPGSSNGNWYTLYLDGGLRQQGRTAALTLHYREKAVPVVQVIGPPAAREAADGFSTTWQMLGHPPAQKLTDAAADRLPSASFGVVLLWQDAAGVEQWLRKIPDQWEVILSAGLVPLPQALRLSKSRGRLLLIWPWRLPDEQQRFLAPVRRWLQVHNVPEIDLKLQADIYFLGWMFTGALRAIGNEFYRDYLLDMFDMMQDQTYAHPFYPRLSFGPGQRFASKGGYVLTLTDGEIADISPWLTQ